MLHKDNDPSVQLQKISVTVFLKGLGAKPPVE
jgi:hypothetical protein